jgi:hypothetical protein
MGTCDTSTGLCSTPNAPNDTSCATNLYGSCQSGACTCYQGVSPVSCTSGGSCFNWGFESGAEGWGLNPVNPSSGITNITVSASRFHTGGHSFAVSMSIGAYSTTGARGVSVAVPLCASTGTINLAGYTFSAWVYFTVSAGTIPMNAANLIQGMFTVKDSPTTGGLNTAIPVSQATTNQWLHLQGNINQTDAMNYLAAISVGFPLADPNSEGFSGTMYIDDVQITPP